jgi:RNA polymerase sigma-70 factor (ECF subfamily)
MEQEADFNDIYLSLHERVYRLSVGIVGNREEAEDVAQELYERLWPRRQSVVAHPNPAGYILASARNMCLDRLRGRRPRIELSPALEGGGEREGDEMTEIVVRLVAALPEKQRTAMRLRDVECMEMEEIARAMGIRQTAVRMALSRARSTVRERLLKIMNYGI